MPIRNLSKIFQPKHVAVIGASPKRSSLGFKVRSNLDDAGFPGAVYSVNPKHQKIGDAPCYAKVTELSEAVDLAIVCTPARTVPDIVRQCGERGIPGWSILSAGFREIGKDGEEFEQAIRREAARFDGMRIVGPNCLGIIAPHAPLNASFASGMPPRAISLSFRSPAPCARPCWIGP